MTEPVCWTSLLYTSPVLLVSERTGWHFSVIIVSERRLTYRRLTCETRAVQTACKLLLLCLCGQRTVKLTMCRNLKDLRSSMFLRQIQPLSSPLLSPSQPGYCNGWFRALEMQDVLLGIVRKQANWKSCCLLKSLWMAFGSIQSHMKKRQCLVNSERFGVGSPRGTLLWTVILSKRLIRRILMPWTDWQTAA